MKFDYRVLGERIVAPDVGRLLGRPLCIALGSRYAGLRFLQVSILVQSDMAIEIYPEGDLIQVSFDVAGSAVALERHRFGHPSWWAGVQTGMPRTGRQRLCTPGLGSAYAVFRNRSGYRISGARYDDALDRLLPLFMPALLGRLTRHHPPRSH